MAKTEYTTPPGLIDPLMAHRRAIRTVNVGLLKDCFTSVGQFMGTDDSEVWHIDEYAELLRDSKGWRMTGKKPQVRLIGDVAAATFYEFLRHDTYGAMRGSGVVVRCTDGKWRIQEYVLSFSVPNAVVEKTNFLKLLARP